jgi:HSP20 family protein
MTEATKLPVRQETKTSAPAAASGAQRPFEHLRREIDRVFENFHPMAWHLPFARSALELAWPHEGAWSVTPAVDVSEKEKQYEITAELPGMDEKDIDIKFANGMLTIKGQKKEEKEEREKDYYISERRYGSFMRSFQVPEGVDTSKIEASFAKGVLTVTMPKSADAQKNEKKITVKAA